MSLLNIFKRKATKQKRETMEAVNRRISKNQETVFQAVRALAKPCTGRMVATYLNWDSASITNRLAELNKKGRIKIAYNKRGLDGVWRHYYVVNDK